MKFPRFRSSRNSSAASLIIILNDDCAENRTILFPLSILLYTMNEQMNEPTNLDLTSRPGSFLSNAALFPTYLEHREWNSRTMFGMKLSQLAVDDRGTEFPHSDDYN